MSSLAFPLDWHQCHASTKLLKLVVSFLRRVGMHLVIYMDNLLLMNQNPIRPRQEGRTLSHARGNWVYCEPQKVISDSISGPRNPGPQGANGPNERRTARLQTAGNYGPLPRNAGGKQNGVSPSWHLNVLEC